VLNGATTDAAPRTAPTGESRLRASFSLTFRAERMGGVESGRDMAYCNVSSSTWSRRSLPAKRFTCFV